MTEEPMNDIYAQWETLVPQMPSACLEFCEERGINIMDPEEAVSWFICFSKGYLTGMTDAERLIDDVRSSCESKRGQKSLLDLLCSS